jgi:hypothetical protein
MEYGKQDVMWYFKTKQKLYALYRTVEEYFRM